MESEETNLRGFLLRPLIPVDWLLPRADLTVSRKATLKQGRQKLGQKMKLQLNLTEGELKGEGIDLGKGR